MQTANQSAANLVSGVNRRLLSNNVQRVLLSLVNTSNEGGWVARTALRVPSVGSRLRDLRKNEYGGFTVECASASDLNRLRPSEATTQQTYYRIVPRTVTVKALSHVLKGVM